MGFLVQFLGDDVKKLDLREIEILKATIQNEIRTSSTIQGVLRARVRQVFNELKAPGPGSPPQTA